MAEAGIETQDTKRMAARATGVVSIAIMSSRVLGLARETIINAMFGAGGNLDMFIIAFRVPNLLRNLFAEGALSTAFITTFSKKIATEGDAAAWRLANKVGTLALIVMSAIVLLGVVFAGPVISLLAGGFHGERAEITAHLTAVMFPFILMVSMSALVMGMLNAKLVFGWPALSSTFFNIGSIFCGIGLAYMIEPQAHWLHPQFGTKALFGLAIGVLIGGCLQLLVQIPALFRVGFRPRFDFDWRDEGVATVLRIMAPAVIAASAVQVNVTVNTAFATHCEPGSVTWLHNAFRLMQLPLGIFGVAIGTVTLPLLSKSIALGRDDDFRSTLARGMRLAFLLTVPATLGLILLAKQIMTLIYGHGAVTPYQVSQMAAALQFYSIGLAAYSAMKVLTPAFYAIDQKMTPMVVSFAAIGVNLLLNWVFTFRLGLGHKGLALSTSLVAMVNFVVFYAIMRKHAKGLESRQMLVTIAKICVAGVALAAVCAAAHYTVFAMWDRLGFLLRLMTLVGTILAAGGAFFVTAHALRIEEIEDVMGVVRRKFAERSG